MFRLMSLDRHTSANHPYGTRMRRSAAKSLLSGTRVPFRVPFRTQHPLGVVVNRPRCGLTDDFSAPCWSVRRNADSWEADAMRKLTYGMNLSLDGYIAAPGDDLGWSVPSDELFQWWSDRVGATGLALYGRKLWETMSSHWPTADQQPGVTPAEIEFARRW
ncbi:MAG TPA: hypothetical protein VHJ54_01235, partial [Solirubrobacterales bacterium]|nr:hypothetical protein [Solirubrobacterales bacterium]